MVFQTTGLVLEQRQKPIAPVCVKQPPAPPVSPPPQIRLIKDSPHRNGSSRSTFHISKRSLTRSERLFYRRYRAGSSGVLLKRRRATNSTRRGCAKRKSHARPYVYPRGNRAVFAEESALVKDETLVALKTPVVVISGTVTSRISSRGMHSRWMTTKH
jgi:hypothetical protein